jgi:hypothetical protein
MPGTSGERALLAVLPVVVGGKSEIRNPKSEIQGGGRAGIPAGLLLAHNDFLCYRPSPTAYRQRCVLCNERKAGVEMLLA